MSGLELQEELNRRGAIIPVIFTTGHGDVPSAVEAMKRGAFNYLQKPFKNAELIESVKKALDHDRNSFTGTFTLDQFGADETTLLEHIGGTMTGARFTVD